MWTALALFGTPIVCLTHLGIAYALVMPACGQQSTLWLHALGAGCTALAAVCAVGGLRAARAPLGNTAAAAAPFLRTIAWPVGVLFTLVTAEQWLTAWMLSPCVA